MEDNDRDTLKNSDLLQHNLTWSAEGADRNGFAIEEAAAFRAQGVNGAEKIVRKYGNANRGSIFGKLGYGKGCPKKSNNM